MTLYIKQKLFSLGVKYEILDSNPQPVYRAKGNLFTTVSKEFTLFKKKINVESGIGASY